MTISSNLSTVTRNGNGVATQFSFPFKVWDISQLDVYITDPDGATTPTSNFTAVLSGTGGSVMYPASGGAILPTGWKIVINRNMPFTQNVDLVNGQAFYPDVIEQALDELTATCQQLDEGLSRSVKVDPGQTDPAALLTQIQAAVTNSGNSATAAASSASAADLSAVSAAASAAAAQAAAETLSPATTTARGIGRVATSADLVDGATISNGPAFLAAGSEAERLLLRVADKYDVGEFYYFRHPTIKPGFAPLQGGLISGAYQGKNITEYPIWAYLQTTDGQLLCKTEAQWQAMTTATWATLADGTTVGWGGIGGAPFYVQDLAAGTLRMPDVRGMYAEAAGFDSLGVGGVHGDAIRQIFGNITGQLLWAYWHSAGDTSSAMYFSNGYLANVSTGGSSGYRIDLNFSASRRVPTATKNQPRAWGALACAYLGQVI